MRLTISELLLALLGLAVWVYALKAMHAVVVPFLVALFLYYLTHPVVKTLVRWRWPHWAAVGAVVLALSSAIGVFLAVPLLVLTKIVCERISALKPIAAVLEDPAQG